MHRPSIFLLPFFIASPPLDASCVPYASPCAAFELADIVATVRLDAAWHPAEYSTVSRGAILKRYKGTLWPGTAIEFFGAGVCYEAPYKAGAVYVVYAKKIAGDRYSTDCTRTSETVDAPRNIAFLERYSLRPRMTMLVEPFGCNERRMPEWLHELWIRTLELRGVREGPL